MESRVTIQFLNFLTFLSSHGLTFKEYSLQKARENSRHEPAPLTTAANYAQSITAFLIFCSKLYTHVVWTRDPLWQPRGRKMHRRGLLWQLSLRTLRFYSSQAPPSSTKGLLATLRRKTGFPIGKCKQALTQHDNNIEAAEKWLYSQAQKEGWVKLEKLQGRATKQGLIGVIVRENRAAMVEVRLLVSA